MSLEEINSSFKVGLFCRYPFPNGLAATNRIRTYFNGLHLNGADCYVFILRPTENYTLIKDSFFGSVDGINYFYPFSKYYSKYKFVRVFSGFLHFIFIITGTENHTNLDYNYNGQISTCKLLSLLIVETLLIL